jgi:hypothetical protein
VGVPPVVAAMTRAAQSASPEYHAAHLSFIRVEIVEAAARREPILDKLLAYTRDVVRAERDRAGSDQEPSP